MIAICGAEVFTGRELVKGKAILIRERRIVSLSARIPRKAERIEAEGLFALPGMIDLHIHLALDGSLHAVENIMNGEPREITLLKMAENARNTLRAGITTVRDLGAPAGLNIHLKRAIDTGILPGPRIVPAGELITKTGGHGYFMGVEADGPWEIRKAVRTQIKKGADVIKIMATGGVLTPGVDPRSALYTQEEILCAVEEARLCGKTSSAHAQGGEGIRHAVLAGITTVEHGIYLDDELVDIMLQTGTALVPTLTPSERLKDSSIHRMLPDYVRKKASQVLPVHRKNFRKYCRSGLLLGLGTDAGVPGVPHPDLLTELRAFSSYGFSNPELLEMVTAGNASIMRLEEVGTLQSGKLADIVLVEGNPLETLDALKNIRSVLKSGTTAFSSLEPLR